MANKKLILRVGTLSLMGAAAALFAAQAGVLPGVNLGSTPGQQAARVAMGAVPSTPGVRAPAAPASVVPMPRPVFSDGPAPIGDTFAATQMHVFSPTSGFATAPVLAIATPALATSDMLDNVRPAAFSTDVDLPLPGTSAPRPEATAELSPFGLPCGLDVTADATDGAMIALGIAAPCHPDAVVTISHRGMVISDRTDAVGLMTLDLPALASPATITVTLPDGTAGDTVVQVPDLADFDRVAVAWQGSLGVELHAMEAGASWMSDGHIRPTAPRDPSVVAQGSGFLTLLGDAEVDQPMLAQVFTMPRQGGARDVALSLDAPVTLANCGQTVEAGILHADVGRTELVPLRFTYPACDAVGDTLVLQNVFRDRRLAAN
jgi:hypothetical protein